MFSAAVFALLVGCASAPERQTMAWEADLPTAWAAGGSGSSDGPEGWLRDFEAPMLPALVAEAQRNNPDLQATAARFGQALAESGIAGAARLPTAGLGVNGVRQELNTFGPFETEDRPLGDALAGLIPAGAPPAVQAIPEQINDLDLIPSPSSRFTNYQLQLNLQWEADLWGRLRDRDSAALAQAQARQADWRGARLSLAAQVAKSWFNLAEAKQQVVQARKTMRSYADSLATLEERFQRGLSQGLELRMVRSQTAAAQSELTIRQRALEQAARQLEVLLGRYPSAELAAPRALPPLPAAIPAGLPSGLLTRRPDLIAAERRLAAAEREVSAARKERLPQFALTASGGTSSREFNNLIDSDFSVWSLGANLTQPIFQGGRIRANIDRSLSLREQAAAAYRSRALQAFLEVESTLAAEHSLQQEYAQLSLAAEESREAEVLAWERYRKGTGSFMNVLDNRRSAATYESNQLRLRNQLLKNRLDLYLALGGDIAAAASDNPMTAGTDAKPGPSE